MHVSTNKGFCEAERKALQERLCESDRCKRKGSDCEAERKALQERLCESDRCKRKNK